MHIKVVDGSYALVDNKDVVLAVVTRYGSDSWAWVFKPLVQGNDYEQSPIPLNHALDYLKNFKPTT